MLKSRALNHELFCLAITYAQSGRLSENEGVKKENPDFAGPSIMCYSFSIELLLKFFIVIDYPDVRRWGDFKDKNIDIRGHVYSKLYNKIKPKYQAIIAESYSKLVNKPVDAVGFENALRETGDDPFRKWRYIYEESDGNTLNLDLLRKVVDALGKAAEYVKKNV